MLLNDATIWRSRECAGARSFVWHQSERNSRAFTREQLTLIRIFEELRDRGYDGGYDAARRYARRWSKERGQSTAAAYVPLSH
jgi:hypothetical protein